MRVGHGDVCGQFIRDVRNSQKIEWSLHHGLPFDPGEVQRLN